MRASHNGVRNGYAAIAERMLARLVWQALRCGMPQPLRFSFFDQAPPQGQRLMPYNNRSGKHAGFLAYCVQHQLSSGETTPSLIIIPCNSWPFGER